MQIIDPRLRSAWSKIRTLEDRVKALEVELRDMILHCNSIEDEGLIVESARLVLCENPIISLEGYFDEI